jgi:hypothetical protein
MNEPNQSCVSQGKFHDPGYGWLWHAQRKVCPNLGPMVFSCFFPTEAGSAQSWSCLSNPIVSSHATQRHQARGIWTRMTWDILGPDLCEIHLNTINTYKYWDSGIFSFFNIFYGPYTTVTLLHIVVEGVCSACEDDFQMWLPMCREGSGNGEFLQFGAGRWSWCHGCGRRVMCWSVLKPGISRRGMIWNDL